MESIKIFMRRTFVSIAVSDLEKICLESHVGMALAEDTERWDETATYKR